VILGLQFGSLAQNSLRYKWSNQPSPSEVLDTFKNEDAYLVFRKKLAFHTYEEIAGKFTPKTVKSEHKKIKILTKSGVDYYANVVINIDPDYSFNVLDARTIKASGEIIRIDEGDIKIKRYRDPTDDKLYLQGRLSLRDVEVNDEIEVFYSAVYESFSGTNEEFFHEDLPCVRSEFQLKVKAGLITQIRSMNNLGKGAYTMDEQSLTETFKWVIEMTPGIKNDLWSIPQSELPYVFYYLEKVNRGGVYYPVSIYEWEELYKVYDNYFNDNGKNYGFDKLIKEYVNLNEADLPYDKFTDFVTMINKTFDIVNYLPESERNSSFYDYMQRKRIDYKNLEMLYSAVLKELDLPFWYIATRNRYRGDIYVNIIHTGQISHSGFIVLDKSQHQHFLFPSFEGYRFFMDEIPFFLQGATFVKFQKENGLLGKVNIAFGTIPTYSITDNLVKIETSGTLDSEKGMVNYEMRLSLSGVFSSGLRKDILQYQLDNDDKELKRSLFGDDDVGLNIDTVYVVQVSEQFPHSCIVRVKGSEPAALKKVDETTYSLTLGSAFPHSLVETSEYPRQLDLTPPGLINERINLHLTVDGATFLNHAQFNTEAKNEIGMYSLISEPSYGNTMSIFSSYIIGATSIPKEKYGQLKDLNEKVEQYNQVSMLFTLGK